LRFCQKIINLSPAGAVVIEHERMSLAESKSGGAG
jgi:hypothetical protein